MKSAFDSSGRVVVPKAPRPAPTPMKLVRRRGGRVAVPKAKLPPLTDDLVRDTIERTRR